MLKMICNECKSKFGQVYESNDVGVEELIILDLFSGGKSLSKALQNENVEIITLDFEKKYNPDICIDILDNNCIQEIEKKLNGRKVEYIWASPPCEKWSFACGVKGGNIYFESIKEKRKMVDFKIRENFDVNSKYKILKNHEEIKREAINAMRIVDKTFAIINYFKPKHWCIENPKDFMEIYINKNYKCITNFCTYCQYGFEYRKPTTIFSDIDLQLKSCKIGEPCHFNNFYCRGKSNKIRNTSLLRNYIERSEIPRKLIVEIFKKLKEEGI